MSKASNTSGEAFAIQHLRENPNLTFEQVDLLARQQVISLQSIEYGRARQQLGLTATTPPMPKPQTKNTDGHDPVRNSTPAFQFIVYTLRQEPAISYSELKSRATENGLKVAPIMYGRAKALLGLVPVSPRGQGKNRKSARSKRLVRLLKNVKSPTPDQFINQLEHVRNVEDIVGIVKQLDSERRRLRGLLEHITISIEEVLCREEAAS